MSYAAHVAKGVEVAGVGSTRNVDLAIDRTYVLAAGPEAISHVVEGHAQGTTVISMNGASGP